MKRRKKRRKDKKDRSKLSTVQDTVFNRPFSELKKLSSSQPLEKTKTRLNKRTDNARVKTETTGETLEDRIFLEAMEGVIPIENNHITDRETPPDDSKGRYVEKIKEPPNPISEFEELINGGWKLPVSLTSEYVEGTGSRHDRMLTRKLHKGHFSVRAYCELHGLDSSAALEECNLFMQNAIARNLSCVAFIHGRGLSSRGEPVIKKLVINWLKNGPFRHFVRAYASAPAWDGGAGVTYVLLSRRKRRIR